MLNLFYLSESWRLALVLLGLAAFIGQLILLVLLMYRSNKASWLLAELALELLGLFSSGFMTYLLVVVGFSSSAGLVFLSFAPAGLYILGALFCLLGSLVFYRERRWISLLAPLAVTMLLPCWNKAGCFKLLFTLSLLVFLFRSILLAGSWWRILHSNLSELSVQQALDNLPSGILFYAKDGYIHMQNKTMNRLIFSLLGRSVRDGHELFAALLAGDVQQGQCQQVLADAVIFKLADQSVWRFKHDLVLVGKNNYQQLAAVDITEQWQLTEELAEQEERLVTQKADLEQMLADLARLSSRQELQKRKDRVHDVIGQRVALVQNAIRSQETDLTVIGRSLTSLAAELARDSEPVAATLAQIISSFASVGVTVQVQGELKQNAASLLTLDLIREAVSNAVRHGLASEIRVNCQEERDRYVLTIANNGSTPPSIIEAGGIRAMREKIKPFAGKLEIRTRPEFVLHVQLEKLADGGFQQ